MTVKTLFKYLIGTVVGLAAGFLLKPGDGVASALVAAGEFSVRIGRYLLIPLIFFSFTVAVTKLRRMGKLGTLLSRSGLYMAAAAAGLALIGTFVAWAVGFGRIPVVPGARPDMEMTSLGAMARGILQMNGFKALVGNPSFLLPVVIPAFILGWHLHHDREIAEPTFNLFDSLSRVLYRANRYLLALMPILLAVLSAGAVIGARRVVDIKRFFPLLGIVLGLTVILIFGIYPLVLWLLGGRRSPWKALAGTGGALLGAFVSGSPLFNYGNFTFHLKENLKVRRHTAAVTAPVYLMFARAGTAMVSAVCMLTVIRSYSSLEITLFQAAWTALFSFLVSFALPAAPDRGLTAALVMMGALYGRGLDDGWLILAPALPLLALVTAVLDTATAALLILLANKRCGLDRDA